MEICQRFCLRSHYSFRIMCMLWIFYFTVIIICLCADAVHRTSSLFRAPPGRPFWRNTSLRVRACDIVAAAAFPLLPLFPLRLSPYAPTDTTPRSMHVPCTTTSNNIRAGFIVAGKRAATPDIVATLPIFCTVFSLVNGADGSPFIFSTLTHITSASYTPRSEYRAPSVYIHRVSNIALSIHMHCALSRSCLCLLFAISLQRPP